MSGPQTPPVTPAAPPAPPPDGGGAPDWIATLAPEQRAIVEAKGYKTPADVVTAYGEAQKLIGADKIVVPKDGVWDDAAREKLGIPKDASGYKIEREKLQLPQGMAYDENFEKAALPVAAKLGLTPTQLTGLMEFYTGYAGEAFKGQAAALEAGKTEAATALKAEWGAAFPTKLELAKRAVSHFGGEKLAQMLSADVLGNNPELVRAFAKIGETLGESAQITGKGGGFSLTPAEAKAEASKLMQSDAYLNSGNPEHKATVQRVQELFQLQFSE